MAASNRNTASGQPQLSQFLPSRTVPSGQASSTVHYLGTAGAGLTRSGITPLTTQQQGIPFNIKTEPKSSTSGSNREVFDTKPAIESIQSATMASTKIPQSPGPSPRKRVKLEEKPPANQEIGVARKLILDERYIQMKEIKENYMEHLTECFYLQSGQNLMDFHPWKKRPTPQLVQFLKSGRLDSDDEEENPLVYLQEKDINKEVKVLTTSGSNVPVATPVAISTTLPASVTALSSQAAPFGRTLSLATTTVSTAAGYLHRSVSDTKLSTLTAHSTKTVMSTSQSGSVKRTPPGSPGRHKQNSLDGTNIAGITTQEAIVERAKQEAQVMSRVSELRKEGLWSTRRLPKVQEPPRNKAHWDYLLEEMQWLAADFAQERKWKKAAARKLAKMVQKHFQDLEQKELKAEKEEGMKLKRVAGQMAKMIKEFWANIEKVVQYKQQSRLDEKRKKALDLHLNFIVDQTEKYSSWLTEGLKTSSKGSLNTTPDSSVAGDDEFKPEDSESDDEETIDKDEEGIDESETKDEIAALQKESEVPLDQLLESLPKEILEKPASISSEKDDTDKNDDEFEADEDSEIDVEETIEEQEKFERKKDVKQELEDLKDEGEMDIEELRAKYAKAYDSDFEMPEESDYDEDESDGEDSDVEDEESEEEEEEVDVEGEDDVGLEALVHSAETAGQKVEPEEEEGPGKQLTDIAAQAASLQPKGYTLQTTEVKTKIPFLLKHTLREYQHVGLDWLATMFEKRLNGILADEMGLGKTIQTIALLAHLACEKSIWGPHLIVVPTSVMLNWEMEIKKWCPAFKILTYYGTQKERKLKRMGWTKTNAFHICITSYKLVIQDHQSFRRKKWKYLILDEAQNIKNFKSQRWQTLLNFNSLRRLLLTGTPLQNSLMELWSLMHFLMPQVFQSHREFKEWFANPLTGMIEGSHEYNEKLIHRLHKVLRPFLLRRLKDDVEKQMPKKYEHIVMCHLAKRQRFLYDEFMAQGKTKETLASGHFMSVINILMQLRKVCNHPSLFDPRPIVSPFQMEGLVYNTASMVLNVLKYDPLENIDIRARYPTLADMEEDLPAFIAHRVRKLKTSPHLIEEIDSQPSPPPRPPAGKLKTGAIRCVSPGIPSGRASPQVSSRSVSPATFGSNGIDLSTEASAVLGTPQPSLQAKVLPQSVSNVSSTSTTQSATSQAITVQIQRTDQGTRFVVPSGFLQIVQTSTGQHLIATSSASSSVTPVISASSTVVNGEPVVTMATSSVKTSVSSVVSQVKMSPSQHTSSVAAVKLPEGSTVQDSSKPVMRVSPLIDSVNGHQSHDGVIFTTASTSSTNTVPVMSTRTTRSLKHTDDLKKLRKKEFFMEPLYVKRRSRRKEQLNYIIETNKKHCDVKPVYGQDLCDAVNIFIDPYGSKQYVKRDRTLWHGPGQIHCHCAKFCRNPDHPKYLWNQTKVLSDVIHTPEQYLAELQETLERFVFVIPPVQCPRPRMHVSHPTPSYLQEERLRDHVIHTELSRKAANYHKIATKMTVQFPELRLIQYDCGKLQTMDVLLRRLKSEDHRVLIFTQMTKMLNILEAFLNYHGHRYLRLDGTTKVEQRQLLMDRFNADRRIFCFILSTRSGGIGVNLTGADTVIFYDSDWNPTMDAQAQDRCHRIGQTRDVHIYRLISERTVEENILKKANQKRMLGDMAIEGGNFTTTFFKEQTISELFSEPSGLDSLVKEKEEEERAKQEKADREEIEMKEPETEKEEEKVDAKAMLQFEKALAKTEDETDAISAEQVKAEQKAELAEFDENIPWDEQEAANKEEDDSRVEKELAMLEKELSPVERYAVQFAELQLEPVNAEELMIAEEDIVNAKKDWELNRLKALKEEEERRLELEEDEMLYTYSRDDAYQQVFLSDIDNEEMPIWCPPTPPHDENDVYIDKTIHFLYEPTIMPETQLPPVYVKKEKKKIKVESITTRTQKQKRQEQPRVPRSLFDRPTAQLLKLRRDAKIQKLKQGQLKLYRPMPSMPQKPIMDSAPDHPEWLIHEDWALLQAVQSLFDVPLNLMIVSPAHTPNWDMVADVVNSCSRVYRSPKQCRLRYENVIIPREEGRILYDMNPRKQKKTKGIYKVTTTKNNRPMKTSQIHGQDSNNGVTLLYSLRFDSVKGIATKRPPTMRQTLVNPTQKNPKHASVLQENSITYDQPMNPMQVAEIRAQRIQREKKQNQQQQATAAQAQVTDQTNVSTAAPATQRPPQIATITPPQVSAATLVAVTSGVATQQLATLGTVSSTATVLTVTGVPPVQTAVRTKTPIQEISSGITATVPMATSQVRAQLQTGTTTVTTGLTQVQLAQRISAATTIASGATVQQQFQAAGKTLTPQQYQLLRTQTLKQQQQQALQQQQQLRMQRLTLVSPDQLKQQPFRQLKSSVIQGGQKTVIAQQLVTSMPQTVKQGQLKTAPVTTLTRPLTLNQEEFNKLKQQQLVQQQKLGQVPAGQQVAGTSGSVAQIQHHAQAGQLQTTQIIAAQGPVQKVAQNLGTVPGSQAATLVKTVSAGSVTIPVSNVNISLSMPPKAKINTQQMQLFQQRKQPVPGQKAGVVAQKAPQMLNAVQIIQQQAGSRSLTVQQLHQLMKQQPQTIQHIIQTSQPTIIATVTQSQQQPQHMVTKVVNTAAATSGAIQTITAGGSSSTSTSAPVISLSQVPVPSLSVASGQTPLTANIVKPAGGSDGVTTVQIHPVSSLTQSKLVVPQNVVVQPIQQISGSSAGQTHVIQAQSLTQTQQHVTLAGTSQGPVHVTLPGASQVQHVTVATPQPQQVTVTQTQPTQVNVTVVSQPSTPTPNPGPMTVTVTPAPVTPSPIQTPTQPAPSPVHTPVQAPVTLTYAAPAQTITLTPTSVSTQPVAVTDQTVQQTVAAVVQPRQQTPTPAQPATQQTSAQIQVQTPSVAQTQAQPQQAVPAPQTPAQQGTVQSPQPTGKSAPYAMRTRKQSDRQ